MISITKKQVRWFGIVQISLVLLISLFTLVACTEGTSSSSQSLSAQEAEEIIVKELSGQFVLANLDIQEVKHKSALHKPTTLLMPLQEEGLITSQKIKSQTKVDYYYILINLTEKGKKYAVGGKKVSGNGLFLEVRACEKKLVKVTGIQRRENSGTRWAIARYEWTYGNPTPFAYLSSKCRERAIQTGHYKLALYDEEWRIED